MTPTLHCVLSGYPAHWGRVEQMQSHGPATISRTSRHRWTPGGGGIWFYCRPIGKHVDQCPLGCESQRTQIIRHIANLLIILVSAKSPVSALLPLEARDEHDARVVRIDAVWPISSVIRDSADQCHATRHPAYAW